MSLVARIIGRPVLFLRNHLGQSPIGTLKTTTYLLALLLCASGQLPGQLCGGNLGDNIFTDGDFGSGIQNVPPTDPQIAPGYNYNASPPPNDGFYCLTNDIGQWPSNFGWAQIGDNSPDPNGYMMVVNASYAPGLFYQQEVTGLCENTLYAFSADVFNLIRIGGNLIKPNISFLIDGNVIYNTGNVPENEQWNTYGFTFSTQAGQTSVTLGLANNAPGGNGNDIALDNISFRPCGPEALVLPSGITNLCESGSPVSLVASIIGSQYNTPQIQWQRSTDQGATWTNLPGANLTVYTHTNLQPGDYYYRYLLANAPSNLLNTRCRIVSETKIVRVLPILFEQADTLCDGLSYPFGGSLLTSGGAYRDSLVSSFGCDSIVELDLTFLPDDGIAGSWQYAGPRCSNTSDGSIAALAVGNGYPPYAYFLNGQPLPGGSATGLEAGSYVFSIVDRYGCRLDTAFFLDSPPPFTVDLEPDWDIELGDSVQLSGSSNDPIALYAWSPPGLVACDTNCGTVGLLPPRTGYYRLDATSEAGCLGSDSVYITVREVRKVFIPSAFTPNGDGLNDYFTVMGQAPALKQVDRLLLFDRWGGVVFEKANFPPNQPEEGWNGTAKGKPVMEGVYPYVVDIRFLDDVVERYSGTVTLYR